MERTAAAFRIYGNSYYVGTRGLGAILITSDDGHVLIDGALPESAGQIAANIEALGFRLRDVKLIFNSHAHYDHCGGIAALQKATGAEVAASRASAATLRSGRTSHDDPQYRIALSFPAVERVREFRDGETLRVGPIALKAHVTPGHAPGGTTYTWRSCEGKRCLDLVYADSLTAVSAEGLLFSRSDAALENFARSFAAVERLPCDILVTPHPAASRLFERLESGALVDREACRKYAEGARKQLAKRIESEAAPAAQ